MDFSANVIYESQFIFKVMSSAWGQEMVTEQLHTVWTHDEHSIDLDINPSLAANGKLLMFNLQPQLEHM